MKKLLFVAVLAGFAAGAVAQVTVTSVRMNKLAALNKGDVLTCTVKAGTKTTTLLSYTATGSVKGILNLHGEIK